MFCIVLTGTGIAKLPDTGSTFSAESTKSIPWLSIPGRWKFEFSFLRPNERSETWTVPRYTFCVRRGKSSELLLADRSGRPHTLCRNFHGFPLHFDPLLNGVDLQSDVTSMAAWPGSSVTVAVQD